jgi:hypothetical protein
MAFSLERSLVGLFGGDAEATNFSAHLAWSLVSGLVGFRVYGHVGAVVGASLWCSYTLINEFFLHVPEGTRELTLNLCSRLIPAGGVLIWSLTRILW